MAKAKQTTSVSVTKISFGKPMRSKSGGSGKFKMVKKQNKKGGK